MRPFHRFFRIEAASGVALLAATGAALVVANSPLASAYERLWAAPLAIGPASAPFILDARTWVNDGLMTVFFLLVGLEIKRELLVGELSTLRHAALPLAGALGGVAVPALVYRALAPPAALDGWAIPTATDIAFAMGVLSIVAPRAPAGLKVFLAALAILDDMSAVLLIAVVYTPDVQLWALASAVGVVMMLLGLNRAGVRHLGPYLVLGLGLWILVHESGAHATLAGVALALTIPSRSPTNALEFSREARAHLEAFDRTETGDLLVLTSRGQQEALHALESARRSVSAPLLRLEHALHTPTAFFIVPIFAFANAGVPLGVAGIDSAIAMAVAVGLVVGKPLGICLACRAVCSARAASLPEGVTWPMLFGVSWIAGIGFTMSLFIAGLAFGHSSAYQASQVGILAGSALAAIGGTVMLRSASRR